MKVSAPEELASLQTMSSESLLKLWCLKEASVKSARTGMFSDARNWNWASSIVAPFPQKKSQSAALQTLIDEQWWLSTVVQSPSEVQSVANFTLF
ncbi:MAG: 4'-phosphopantetheinyl transferase superfamily protein [Proteobacteria bacterium]|nr:MAG: 4'-phosphopantetheinyl transferase superfamily protein [Pseudomonadota bacterium]